MKCAFSKGTAVLLESRQKRIEWLLPLFLLYPFLSVSFSSPRPSSPSLPPAAAAAAAAAAVVRQTGPKMPLLIPRKGTTADCFTITTLIPPPRNEKENEKHRRQQQYRTSLGNFFFSSFPQKSMIRQQQVLKKINPFLSRHEILARMYDDHSAKFYKSIAPLVPLVLSESPFSRF